jgi:Spy/CpxP family protein refolding chaperone
MRLGKRLAIGGLLSAGLAFGWASGVARGEDKPAAAPPPGDQPDRPERPGGERGGPPREPGGMLERFRERVDELNLSAEQKTKIDGIVEKAKTDLKAAMAKAADATSPEERRDAIREVMEPAREAIMNALDETQREKLRETMRNAFGGGGRPGGPDGPGGDRPGGPPGREARRGRGPDAPDGANKPEGPGSPERSPMAMFGRVKDSLGKLNLSDEQKKKVEALMAEQQKKISDLQTEAEKQQAEMRGKFRETMIAGHDRLDELLTEEQRTKLREMMPPPRDAREPRGPQKPGESRDPYQRREAGPVPREQ